MIGHLKNIPKNLHRKSINSTYEYKKLDWSESRDEYIYFFLVLWFLGGNKVESKNQECKKFYLRFLRCTDDFQL
jgi:hypothetical protein